MSADDLYARIVAVITAAYPFATKFSELPGNIGSKRGTYLQYIETLYER